MLHVGAMCAAYPRAAKWLLSLLLCCSLSRSLELRPGGEHLSLGSTSPDHDHDHDHDHDGDHEEEGEDITPEIIEEKNVHHVFFEMVGLSNVTIVSASGDARDTNGFGINYLTTWTTGAEEKGEVKVFLIHEPGTKDGDTRAEFGGEDDVIADFEVHVELED